MTRLNDTALKAKLKKAREAQEEIVDSAVPGLAVRVGRGPAATASVRARFGFPLRHDLYWAGWLYQGCGKRGALRLNSTPVIPGRNDAFVFGQINIGKIIGIG